MEGEGGRRGKGESQEWNRQRFSAPGERVIIPGDRKKSGDVPGRLKGARVCPVVKVAGTPVLPGRGGGLSTACGGPIDARSPRPVAGEEVHASSSSAPRRLLCLLIVHGQKRGPRNTGRQGAGALQASARCRLSAFLFLSPLGIHPARFSPPLSKLSPERLRRERRRNGSERSELPVCVICFV